MTRLATLLAKWDAEGLSPEETGELKQLLATPEARAELVDEWLLTETIYDTLHTRAASAAAALDAVPARPPVPVAARSPRPRRLRWLVWREVHLSLGRSFAYGAAACLAFAGLWFYCQKAEVARLSEARAGIVVRRHGQTVPAADGQALYPGDVVTVPPTGRATVSWPGEPSVLTLAAGANLELFNPMFGKRMALRTGALEAAVAPQSRLRPMTILTPEAEARVVGTRFSLTATNALSRLEVLEGAVRFRKTRTTSIDRQSQVLVSAGHTATAAAQTPLGVDWLTGFLSSDTWLAPVGTPLSDAPAMGAPLTPPAATAVAAGASSNLVERLRGYLIAPATGDFVFWVASHRGGAPVELWLSRDEDPAHKRRIASETPSADGGAARGDSSLQADFHRSPAQESAPQTLEQGRRYYLEIWHEGLDLRALGVAWRLPGQPATAPPEMVNLNALCPFVETAAQAARK
jgi:hypothetical protein